MSSSWLIALRSSSSLCAEERGKRKRKGTDQATRTRLGATPLSKRRGEDRTHHILLGGEVELPAEVAQGGRGQAPRGRPGAPRLVRELVPELVTSDTKAGGRSGRPGFSQRAVAEEGG